MTRILVTGTSGFIGFHTAKKLLHKGYTVIGIDNENDYYDITIKQQRRKQLEKYDNFSFYHIDISNYDALREIFQSQSIDKICHLAAQAGVRYSLENPFAYIQANLIGFHNIIDLAKEFSVQNFVYASSSSVYGNNNTEKFSVKDCVDHPISLYAATKKSNELIAHVYTHLYQLPTIGLRFFTVYGPWGRPDMAMRIFADKIAKGTPIDVYNHGKMQRDFTYINDIIDGIIKCLNMYGHHYEIFNLGNNKPVQLEYMISLIEKYIGKTAKKNYMTIQPGDVPKTYADIHYTFEKLGRQPNVSIEEGVKKFVEWYKGFINNE